ncbi:cytochrome c [Alienimonas chondri]|uniref:Cytochrome c n=1 Tax=Alienimonas chondri TaxID=2681879 RepID=A0ABX1V907_9PLAN|nr:cytochrome c [Alienimonas chondri]NNJ23991.1 hypothetical protein [Alienimonas chondri]
MTLRLPFRLTSGCLLAASIPALAVAQQGDGSAKPKFPEVPADVFFPDPFAVFEDQTPVPGAAPVAPSAVMNPAEAPVTGGPVDAVAVGGSDEPETAAVDWAALLPPDALDAQVRAVMEELARNSRDVQTYNNAYLSIPPAAAELGSLFAVGSRYDKGVAWSDNAAALARKAAEINETQLRRGAGGQKQVADPLRTLDALLNGGGAGGGEVVDFAEAADFNLIMKRFQVGVDSLKALASSAQLMEANKEAVEREARVLSVLSEVSADESHGWGFEQEFVALSKKMTKAASETAAAVGQDFDTFDAARRRLSQTCSDCHGEYRN